MVRLRRADVPTPEAQGLQADSPSLAPRTRILVVDDNADAAETLAEALSYLGHEAKVAHDGERALELAAGFEPGVALLDIGLPGMDGYELAERLRTLCGPRLILVAVTGYGQEADLARSRRIGFAHHLIKPVDIEEVQRLIPLPEPA